MMLSKSNFGWFDAYMFMKRLAGANLDHLSGGSLLVIDVISSQLILCLTSMMEFYDFIVRINKSYK